MSYVEVQINQSEAAAAQESIAKLKELLEAAGFANWEANPADLTIIELQTVASMYPALAQIAAVVPPAIFRKYGTELEKLAYNEGSSATATAKWTLLEEGGKYPPRTIEAGTQLVVGEQAFYVESDVSVLEGESTKNVPIIASERGTAFNGLTGVMEIVDAISWVGEVKLIGETSGGAEQESDEEYQDRLAAALALQAPRPITAANFAELILTAPSSVLPAGVTVGRATSIDGYNPATNEPEAKVTSGSAVMTEVTSYTGVTVGTEIVGTGVPKGTTVETLSGTEEGKNELTMSAKATSSPAKGKYKMVGSYSNQRYTTTFVTNKEGKALSSEAMTKLEEWLAGYREINFKSPVKGPEPNKIYIKTAVKLLPGYVEATVKANIETALKSFLSPAIWGNPSGQTTGANAWINYVVKGGVREHVYGAVRYNQVLEFIGAVQGVAYVLAGATGLEIGLEAGSKGTADLRMVGAAPLPEVAEITITAS